MTIILRRSQARNDKATICKRGGRRIREARESARRASQEATPWLYEAPTMTEEIHRTVIGPESRWTALDPADVALGTDASDVEIVEPAPTAVFSPVPVTAWESPTLVRIEIVAGERRKGGR